MKHGNVKMNNFMNTYVKIIKEMTGDDYSEEMPNTDDMYRFTFAGIGEDWEEKCAQEGFIGEVDNSTYSGNPNTVYCYMYAKPEQLENAKKFLLSELSCGDRDNVSDGLEGCEMCELEIEDPSGNEIPFNEFFANEIKASGYVSDMN